MIFSDDDVTIIFLRHFFDSKRWEIFASGKKSLVISAFETWALWSQMPLRWELGGKLDWINNYVIALNSNVIDGLEGLVIRSSFPSIKNVKTGVNFTNIFEQLFCRHSCARKKSTNLKCKDIEAARKISERKSCAQNVGEIDSRWLTWFSLYIFIIFV
jgi:hypothetical protein